MNQVLQGGQYTARVLYRMGSGTLVDPDSPYMDLIAPNGDIVSPRTVLTRDDVGEYHAVITLATDAQVGTWTTQFYGVIEGSEVTAADNFEVIDTGQAAPMVQATLRIRLLLGERIPVGGDESDTRLTDSEIMGAYYANGEDLNKSMAELWMAKAGVWAELTDMDESGTARSLSQMSRAALAQAKVYQQQVVAYDAAWAATYRVVGRSFNVFDCAPRPRWLWEPVTVRA